MSQRLPTGDILNEAFQFAYRRWPTLFQFAWLPILLGALLVIGAGYAVFDAEKLQAPQGSPAQGFPNLREILRVSPVMAGLIWIVLVLGMLFLYSGMFASVYRLAALGEERSGIIQLRFDGPAQRVFWGQLIMTLINYGILMVAGVAALAATGQTLGSVLAALVEFIAIAGAASVEGAPQPGPEAMQHLAEPLSAIFLACMFALAPLIYVNVKLTPFLPGSASENRLLLFGAWRMTSGQFWSILFLLVMFYIAMIVIFMVYSLGIGFIETMARLGGAGTLSLIGGLFGIIGFVVRFVFQIYVMGVQTALPAIVYRRLTTGE